MDLDELLTRRRPGWRRLAELVRRARRSPGALDAEEVDELVEEYLRTSSDLTAVRTRAAEPALSSELTSLVASASTVVYGTTARDGRSVRHAVTVTFPAAVWHLRRAIVVAALLLVVPGVVAGTWIATSADARDALGPADALASYVDDEFTAYYVEDANTVFAARVGTNNATVGATAFGLGILAGLPTAALLAFNGANVGVAGGLFHALGDPAVFWSSILPHGLLELTAIVVAGGAGLHLGWTLLVPGDRTRGRAVAEEGQQAAVVALGLVPTFAVAALLEGYVTPRDWAAGVEVGIGAAVLGVFLLLVVGLGRRAPVPVRAPGTRTARVAGLAQTRPRATSPR
jgi:uncharacterized membrane protein SpoIIM required for sporulation